MNLMRLLIQCGRINSGSEESHRIVHPLLANILLFVTRYFGGSVFCVTSIGRIRYQSCISTS